MILNCKKYLNTIDKYKTINPIFIDRCIRMVITFGIPSVLQFPLNQ
jgi:hypothetical protein